MRRRGRDAVTWTLPKGTPDPGETIEQTALREVGEETGLGDLVVRASIDTIDWFFRFRGQLIHKVCHFYLMETSSTTTSPQHAEGITACRWSPFEEAQTLISYSNAREVLRRAQEMVVVTPSAPA